MFFSTSIQQQQQLSKDDLQHAMQMVKSYDAAGFLPGQLLPYPHMTETYYAVRSFWVQTGLRFGSTTIHVPSHAPPKDHLDWWEQSMESIYQDIGKSTTPTATATSPATTPQLQHEQRQEESLVETKTDWTSSTGTTVDNDKDKDSYMTVYNQHPTLRLLKHLIQRHGLSKSHFDDIIRGRRQDLDTKQYETLEELIQHASLSCGSLFALVLESASITPSTHPPALEAAHRLGKAHGVANALRFSIPIVSTTGKLIIPKDLCQKHGVSSPRYLLSALGQGDAKCQEAMRHVIQDIVHQARLDLEQARALRTSILNYLPTDSNVSTSTSLSSSQQTINQTALAVFLPAIATETFLNKLEHQNYDLTDKNLRNVGLLEPWWDRMRMVMAYYRKQY